MPRRTTLPQIRRHKSSNRAYVNMGGRQVYLGTWGSPGSIERYQALLGSLARSDAAPPESMPALAPGEVLALGELVERWLQYVEGRFGRKAKGAYQARYAALALCKRHAPIPASTFGPRALQAVRADLVRAGHSRQWILKLLGSVRACFRWAVSEELVPASLLVGLKAVMPLAPGAAPETKPRAPANSEAVEACVRWLAEQGSHGAALLLRFMRATGCRPSEAARATFADMLLGGDPPVFQPERHKTAHHGIRRVVPLNQEALAAVVEAGQRWGSRTGMVFPNRNGAAFTPNAIQLAVRRAIRATGATPWSPYGLRHLAATEALARTGNEDMAAALLGHARGSTIIQRYTSDRLRLATQAAAVVGANAMPISGRLA